jgi:hypothetical protein
MKMLQKRIRIFWNLTILPAPILAWVFKNRFLRVCVCVLDALKQIGLLFLRQRILRSFLINWFRKGVVAVKFHAFYSTDFVKVW